MTSRGAFTGYSRKQGTRQDIMPSQETTVVQGKDMRDTNVRAISLIIRWDEKYPCQHCGYNASPVGLDLHNRNPQEKDLNVKKACGYGRQRLLLELEKCDVLCAICHRLVHHKLGYT